MSNIVLDNGQSIVTKSSNGRKGIPVDARAQVQYYRDIQNIEYAYENLQVIVTDDDPEDLQHPKGIYVITKLDANNDVDPSGIESLKETMNDYIRVLFIGNSFIRNEVGYVPFVFKNIAPNIKLTIGMAVIGGSSLAQHVAYLMEYDENHALTDYDNKTFYVEGGKYWKVDPTDLENPNIPVPQGYTYYKSVDGEPWNNGAGNHDWPHTLDSLFEDEKWDIIVYQHDVRRCNSQWKTAYAPYIYNIEKGIKDKINYNVQLGWIATHSAFFNKEDDWNYRYDNSAPSKLLTKWTYATKNTIEVMKRTAFTVLFPSGTAVQNLRDNDYFWTLGDGSNDDDKNHCLMEDYTHLQAGIGCLTAAYANAITIIKSIGGDYSGVIGEGTIPTQQWINDNNIPNQQGSIIGISDNNPDARLMAQIAAMNAVNYPYWIINPVYSYNADKEDVRIRKRVDIDNEPIEDSQNPISSGGVYTALEGKAPSTNIEKSALASDVRTSLGKADTAVQPADIADFITESELNTGLASKENTISANNRISSDFVDDTDGTNKFVTSTEKGLISTAIQGVKKGTQTLDPIDGVVTIPSDIESAHATSVSSTQGAHATIDNNHVLQLEIPRGADAVNPFKGYYPSTKPTGTFADGNYIYAPDSTDGSTTTIWYWNETLSTPDWSDSGKVIDPAALVEFANTSKAVAATNVVNDLITGGVDDVLSAEQGVVLSLEEKADILNSFLRDYKTVEITDDMLSILVWNNHDVQMSQGNYRSLIIKIDNAATYTWSENHAVLGFVDVPKIGDTPQVIGQSLKTISNLTYYKYVMINLFSAGETISYSKSIAEVYGLTDTRRLVDTEFTKTDLLQGATILGGYYNASGQFVENTDFASFVISVDNSVDLNKVFVDYNLMWNSTSLVPSIFFFDDNSETPLISKYEDPKGKHCRVIPVGTTRIAFNLGNTYTSGRGDEFYLVSTNVLGHVDDAIAKLKEKNQSQDEAFVALQESVDEDIEDMQESISKFDYYYDYIDVTKQSSINRIMVYIDEAANIKSSQYELKIDFDHPLGLSVYQLFKATTRHGGLESIGSSFVVGKTYTITKDPDKPVLYIFGSFGSQEATTSYDINILMYAVNKNSVSYKDSILYNNSLANKKIVVFGDSLSEYVDSNGKTWPQHGQEITNADIINVAIGGTQLRQRVPLVRLFKEDVSYTVGDRVFYKPSSTMNCYECTINHTGSWDDNDFTEVPYTGHTYPYASLDIISMIEASCDIDTQIEDRFENQIAAAECIADHYPGDTNNLPVVQRLAGIDWSEIEAVVILAGTNDYGENSNHGQSGSTDISKTMGAINKMVRLLCSTYKHLSLYYISPTVHWRDYSYGNGDPDKWCDVFIPDGEKYYGNILLPSEEWMTRGQFYDSIINEFALNHIPSLNLYKELGWNKYNFSDYFWQDGTHPTKGKGFFMMAKKIVSYLTGNKAF